MAKRLLSAVLAAAYVFLQTLPAFAQASVPGYGWNQQGQLVTNDMPFIVTDLHAQMSQERKLDVESPQLTKTDNGANGTFVIGLGPVLSYWYSTGATTQQAAANAILNFTSLASQDIAYYNGTNWTRLAKGSNGTFLGISGGNLGYYSPAGSGTVTSVAQTVPSWLTVTGSPITGSGTLAIANGTGLTANRIVGSDGSGNLDLMAMTAAQVPSLAASKITSGNLAKSVSATEGVYNDQTNTYTGTFTQDISSANQTLLIPLRSVPTTNGAISINSADLEFRASGATHKAAKQAITITAGTGLTGGGDLSANRTISIGTVPETNGGTNQTTYATGDMLYASGSNALAKRNIGSTGQVLTVSGGVPTWATPGGSFGGSGGDGATTKGAVTETTIVQIAATTITQTVSNTYVPKSGSIFRSTSTQDWNGTTNVALACTTPSPVANTDGARGSGLCPGFGTATNYTTAGGGGGGNGGAGAKGGGTSGGTGGGTFESLITGGSSGGSAGSYSAAGGQGGGGGGLFLAESIGNFTIGSGGSINVNGGAGSVGGAAGNVGGGGGGSGGTAQILCQGTITKTGNVTANGGDGGSGNNSNGGKGGPGGGGRIVLMAPTITGAGSLSVNAGSNAATGDATGLGTAGSGVATSITGTPTTRFAMDMRKNWMPLDTYYHLQADAGTIQPGQELKCEAKGVIQMYAAFNARTQKEQAELAHEYTFGTTLDGVCQAEWVETTCGDEVLKNAA